MRDSQASYEEMYGDTTEADWSPEVEVVEVWEGSHGRVVSDW